MRTTKPKMKKYITNSEKETFNLGKKIATTLKGGEVVALSGNLGAGKTVLIKGIAAGLEIKKTITSPTFVLMKVYPVRKFIFNGIKKLVHIDCYRSSGPDDIKAVGAVDYFNDNETIVVIEWAEKIKKILPKKTVNIKIKIGRINNRNITIK